jgi:hypothetical protein
MSIKLNGATSGSVELDVPAAIGSDIGFTLPGADGSAGQFLQTNGSGVLSLQTATQIDTSVAAVTPGNVGIITFSNIPSTVSRITFSFENVSCAAGGFFTLRLGNSGGLITTGYQGSGGYFRFLSGADVGMNQMSTEFKTATSSAAHIYHGQCVCTRVDSHRWSSIFQAGLEDQALLVFWAGSVDVGSPLTQAAWFWNTGNFDGGTIKMDMEHDS